MDKEDTNIYKEDTNMQICPACCLLLVSFILLCYGCKLCPRTNGRPLKDEFCPANTDSTRTISVFEGAIANKIENVPSNLILDVPAMSTLTYEMRISRVYKGTGDLKEGDSVQLQSSSLNGCGTLSALGVDKIYLFMGNVNYFMHEIFVGI